MWLLRYWANPNGYTCVCNINICILGFTTVKEFYIVVFSISEKVKNFKISFFFLQMRFYTLNMFWYCFPLHDWKCVQYVYFTWISILQYTWYDKACSEYNVVYFHQFSFYIFIFIFFFNFQILEIYLKKRKTRVKKETWIQPLYKETLLLNGDRKT